MKKSMKRLAWMLAAILVIGTTLSGCSSSSSTETTAAETEAETEAAETTAGSEETDAAESEDTASEAADSSDSTEKITIRIGHNATEDNIYQVVCEAFRDKLVELLGEDRVSVEIYANGTLGSQTEMIEMIQMGTLDAVAFGRHSQIDSRLDVLNLPFLFTSDEHQTAVLRGDEGAEIRETIGECFEAEGIYMLGMFEAGFRQITSTKEISSLEDLQGLVIRTPNTDVLMDSFEAWGASPTPLDLNDLYTALQTGVCDAQENPYQLIYTNGYYEVCDYMCVTNHSTICDELQFSKVVMDTYPEDVQEAIWEAGAYACNVAGEENVKRNSELLETLEGLMTVTYMPEEDLAEMKSIAEEQVYPSYTEDELSAQLVEAIQALAD
ncbi:MAG: TRAP transporter substrate-binding protein [Lachnospiraceae bacterium]|nr:TRAP transporter substrate-binding protein [Lachnospiraceae bacterium]